MLYPMVCFWGSFAALANSVRSRTPAHLIRCETDAQLRCEDGLALAHRAPVTAIDFRFYNVSSPQAECQHQLCKRSADVFTNYY
jgi:hypothetical protein